MVEPTCHAGRMQVAQGGVRAGARVAVAMTSVALVLAGCSHHATPSATTARSVPTNTTHKPAPTPTTTTTTTTQTPLAVTPIAWTACNGDLQCGTLTVPLNYAQPQGATIQIAVERHLADDPAGRIGSLVINPGGPGVSGIDDFANELSVLTTGLLDDFDIVTFDPRGVQRSDPITCGNAANAAPGPVPDPVPQTKAAQASTLANLRAFAAACEKSDAALLPYAGTVDVARYMDRLRIALGDRGLTFMGQSYGTLLGLTYAQLFPTHVRAMVLDSVIDPALSLNQMTLGQAQGFEGVLNQFFAWCAGTSACAWKTTPDPTTALLNQIAQSRISPAPGGAGRTAGPGEIYDALLDGLYSQSAWPTLGNALAADADGNGVPIVTMSNSYNTDGSTNGADAAEDIDCLDHPVSKDLSAYAYLAAVFKVSAPVFGPLLAWGEEACAVWPVPPTRIAGAVSAPGAPPILVIGTTQDPATPYAWAVSVSKELKQSALLTVQGSDHVSYFYSSCVRDDVQSYFLSLATPTAGTSCSD
jgi:pimeloyl-ACP methyl ester carboxylesterase